MKVILTETVRSLGNIGEIVNVSAGHARNFLLPQGLAVFADEGNERALANQKRALGKKITQQKEQAQTTKKQLHDLEIELTKRVGANGKLFGTVTTSELSRELAGRGIDIERRLLSLDSPIKSVGTFSVKAKLFEGVMGEFQVKVDMSPQQREELQKKTGAKKRKAAKLTQKDESDQDQLSDEDTAPVADAAQESDTQADQQGLNDKPR